MNNYVQFESSITYHAQAMANVKVVAHKQTDRQTDKRTGQKLYIYTPYRCWSIENSLSCFHTKDKRNAYGEL